VNLRLDELKAALAEVCTVQVHSCLSVCLFVCWVGFHLQLQLDRFSAVHVLVIM